MEAVKCMQPDHLAYFLSKGGHEVLSYDPNIIVTLADRVYVFVLNLRFGVWCIMDLSVAT